jgi:hypothetical protein
MAGQLLAPRAFAPSVTRAHRDQELTMLDDPDNSNPGQRRLARLANDEAAFDPEHFM